MAAFYSNQVQHLYVVNATPSETKLEGGEEVGTVYVGKDATGKKAYVQHIGLGGLTRTDYVDLNSIEYMDFTSASKLGSKLQKVVVTAPTSPIVGEDYILRITVSPFISQSEQNSYIKDAVVHVTSGMTKTTFATAMVESLKKNFKRDIAVNQLFGFRANNGNIEIYGQPQADWKLGKVPVSDVHYIVQVGEVTNAQGITDLWATEGDTIVTSFVNVGGTYYDIDGNSKTLASNSGKKIADLEKWSMYERGDIYGNMGYPYDMPSEPLVNPNQNYSVLNIHHSFKDGGTAYYKSEKDLTFVSTTDAQLKAIADAFKALNDGIVYRVDGVVQEGSNEQDSSNEDEP